ncbi:PRC-barrel domain-containing protein [Armatimonas sp.]|uniref:PRC-barrel domain-containing protein n=1 Tax=Armatimonas sp. TaxID=1872638 RepID=UPI00286CAA21|nr:PRC-barrel domain-containing protein [Armatimonas sp.]
MLYRASSLESYALNALDGQMGKVNHFYFDDESGAIRYAVVDTGKKLDPTDNWFTGRQILLPPSKIGTILANRQLVTTTLTRKEIEESPTTMSDRPVSKQSEEGNYNSLGWPVSWYAPDEETKPWDPHLRSTKVVTGYHVEALDGEIGHVEDFIIDDAAATWTIRYWVIATRNWWPGKKVLILPTRIQEIFWDSSKVSVSLFRSQIQGAPEFTDTLALTPEYETALADYDAQL